mmetsp:Transcript_19458/g.54848  ORF Transcript_19458/g.54848 Transcript_19458/m.54848 type:complete len:241 (-) Transcript_19458:7-729(-)
MSGVTFVRKRREPFDTEALTVAGGGARGAATSTAIGRPRMSCNWRATAFWSELGSENDTKQMPLCEAPPGGIGRYTSVRSPNCEKYRRRSSLEMAGGILETKSRSCRSGYCPPPGPPHPPHAAPSMAPPVGAAAIGISDIGADGADCGCAYRAPQPPGPANSSCWPCSSAIANLDACSRLALAASSDAFPSGASARGPWLSRWCSSAARSGMDPASCIRWYHRQGISIIAPIRYIQRGAN